MGLDITAKLCMNELTRASLNGRAIYSALSRMIMKEELVAGLVSGDKEAIAAFVGSENCIVIDWRDGAEEILDAIIHFLPQDYLAIAKNGDTEWVVRAGGRPARTVEYNQNTRQEDFFVVLNQLLEPDFELRQYRALTGC